MGNRRGGWAGRLALLVPVLLWLASIGALLAALEANEAAGMMMRSHGGAAVSARVGHLRGLAVMWGMGVAGLQILSGLVGAGVVRGLYRLRTAVSFAIGAGGVIVLNVAWLLGLLMWLRIYGDTR